MGEKEVKWTITPEDVGPIVMALNLLLEEINRNLQPDYGIQVAANRIVWRTHLSDVLQRVTQPNAWIEMRREVAATILLSFDQAAACGYALLVAANRLDHFVGVKNASGDPVVAAVTNPKVVELVDKHFSIMIDDLSWLRTESIRLRLHAHRLLDHLDDPQAAHDD